MSAGIQGKNPFGEQILSTLRDMQREVGNATAKAQNPSDGSTPHSGPSFGEYLKQGVEAVNTKQVASDRMAMELATGKTGNIHETMLAATHAELSFNLMVQLRNKALEAYTEIMRMPV